MLVAVNFTANPARLKKLREQIEAHLGTDMAKVELALEPAHFAGLFPEAEVIATYRFSTEQFSQCHKLRWLHLGVAGVEKSLSAELNRSPVVVTNARGIHGDYIAEFVLGAILFCANRFDWAMRGQFDKKWRQKEMVKGRFRLAGKTVGIMGMGAIGSEIAKWCAAVGLRVIGLRRNQDLPKPEVVAEIFSPARIEEFLRSADFIVLALPLTAETRGLLNAERLQMMKPSAYLINVARGDLVDEAALLEMLRARKISGAVLDVFQTEPLPEDHPFWEMDNVLVTPHISGNFEEYVERIGGQFAENLARYVRGEALLNVVDKERGY
ncbi:MAG: D-2-hydroxyacid dehydrogenase [candidate division KSB1 bacterium]|nr:D-2-hydroxyacid dehydrogenase [candidate division KSB1 bacterium]MDZ7302353.1 D-2-hydroxyacid dehydrogenase [candidate division KSB1 bacterium]MDZ7311205.1 D-2-hydroxyacid dehydrogenase [candidate division KSB1 bacterium]